MTLCYDTYMYIYIYIYIYISAYITYTCIHIYIYVEYREGEEKGEVLLRGVGTLRYVLTRSENYDCQVPVQWQPDGLTIHTKKLFLGA